MSIRTIAWTVAGLTAITSFLLRVTGVVEEDSYWRGTGFVIILIAVAVVIIVELAERLHK